MKPTCNILGETHCGRPLMPDQIARQVGAHVNRGDKPHEMRAMFQCKECAAKDAAQRALCSPEQRKWLLNRRVGGSSLREAARALGMDVVRYSALEHLKQPATAQELQAHADLYPPATAQQEAPDA